MTAIVLQEKSGRWKRKSRKIEWDNLFDIFD